MNFLKPLALLIICILLPVASTQAWDATGHMLVDEVAWKQMKPAARAKATELLHKLDSRFNENRPYNFVTAGAWMDDMRGMGRNYPWSKLHYVDIPWTETGTEITVPPPPHVLSAIDDNLNTLRNTAATSEQRTEALAMLIHFVGDLHQPLHTTERNLDRGGNAYLIAGIPFSDLMPRQVSNLHTFWDKAFLFDGIDGKIVEVWQPVAMAARPGGPSEGVLSQHADKIIEKYPRESLPELASAHEPSEWAAQSHKIGCLHAYPAGDPPPNTELRPLDAPFVHEAREIAIRQIALAGYRLADLLNSLLAP